MNQVGDFPQVASVFPLRPQRGVGRCRATPWPAGSRWVRFLLSIFLLSVFHLSVPAPSLAGQHSPEPAREPYHDPALVAAESLVIPGWGQHSNGESGKGWLFSSLAVFGVLLGTEVISPGLLRGGHEEHNLEKSLGWFL